ncbi:MAG: caspase family protein [Pseudomonadota bacterium]
MPTRRNFIQTAAIAATPLGFGSGWAATSDPSRLALVIGNSAYRDSPLINPLNDAKAVGGLLTDAGFTIHSHLNASRADMTGAIERFGIAIKRSEVKMVMFYYAGHGAQLDWRNYLLPVDAAIAKQDDIKSQCVDLNHLIGLFGAAKDKTFVVILDACRDNPFGTSHRPDQKGLSQFDAPVGSLLAYATSPGSVAADGSGLNGLYTENLVRELSQRGTRIEDALKRVRLNVRLASKGAQIPWETTSLESDVFVFNDGQRKLSESELEKLIEADVTEWARIKSSRLAEDWVGYLRKFPNGRFAEIAQMRLSRLLAAVERAQEQAALEEQKQVAQQRLAAERQKQEEEQQRQKEQQALALQRQQEQERLDREREKAKLLDATRVAAQRKKLEDQRLLAEQQQTQRVAQEKLERERLERMEADGIAATEKQKREEDERLALVKAESAAKAKPGAISSPPAVAQGSAIDLRAGVAMPMLSRPSANPFSAGRYPLGRIYTIGDEATFRVTEILTGVESRTFTNRVTKVDYEADRVEFNDGKIVTDLLGNPIKGYEVGEDVMRYDPPLQTTPFELQIGKKWTAAFRIIAKYGNVSRGYLDLQIVKRESISVASGSFDTFRVQGRGHRSRFELGSSPLIRIETELWLVPGLNFPIRTEARLRGMGSYGTERQELVSLRQQVFQSDSV